ncbi:glycolate oxidase subunit GlcF [Silvimonas iriomotensis]|uniref:Glycolate oxidase iron-sulfur subunit n=1 Tax=Silvimonas iriomotensis TaxID=449662 RepID=A0ABQ2P597_9NEIS|nr:glycolate oxidase subunit GlcF [Silvimonas iriomotensis]GGP18524.1 glycolate oxidase iron-sulfur subunit [Silvimonas iriomotensis]
MQTRLQQTVRDTPEGEEAEAILRKCVHCGFCNATCPTYQILGDELDGPRGRIYLIKQMLEGHATSADTRTHLDRCLTCRNCETTCPAGVQYGRLLETGRQMVLKRNPRTLTEQAMRRALAAFLHNGILFTPVLRLGQVLQPALPAALADHIPARRLAGGVWPRGQHPRKIILLQGCVQPSMAPNINRATARVLDKAGIQTLRASGAQCCGAIRQHMDFDELALKDARRNIDAWWPMIEAGAEAIVSNASGCGVALKEYGHRLRNDARYAQKAERVSALSRDIAEIIEPVARQLAQQARWPSPAGVAFHPPCTLQHGLQLRGKVEEILAAFGINASLPQDAHLCCGSAGTYSLFQPDLARTLRDDKCRALVKTGAACIATANIGCLAHLQNGTAMPVLHWIEIIDSMICGTAI